MKSLLKASAGIAALMMGAGMAVAQDAGTTGTQQMASNVTCSDILALDNDEAERALFFIAGYNEAQSMGTATASAPDTGADISTDTTASADTETGTVTGPDSETTASTQDDTSADLGTDTTASADMPSDEGMDDDAAASADVDVDSETTAATPDAGADSEMDSGTTAATDTTAGTDTTTTAAAGSLSGMLGQDIDVESIMSNCQDSPDRMVSQILDEQGGGTGTAQ